MIANHARSGGPVLSLVEMGTMVWLRVMECYTELINQGLDGLAVRYEDLKATPREAARAIVTYCGFPDAPMEAVYRVLEKDSQAGTALAQETLRSRDSGLTDAEKARLAQLLAAQASIQSAGFIVPGTWRRS